jgi:small subunit ribosomal protein S17
MEKTRGLRKVRVGTVVSDKMDKTITVAVVRRVKHPVYGKYLKRTMRLMAHDEKNDCNEGDMVKIMETRPMSSRKRWRLVEVVERKK